MNGCDLFPFSTPRPISGPYVVRAIGIGTEGSWILDPAFAEDQHESHCISEFQFVRKACLRSTGCLRQIFAGFQIEKVQLVLHERYLHRRIHWNPRSGGRCCANQMFSDSYR
jgi:hypothetical protein